MLKLPCNGISNLLEDAFSPAALPCWRRASTLCKAPLKKSTSIVFSASSRLILFSSRRSEVSRELKTAIPHSGSLCKPSNSSRRLYSNLRCTPSFRDSCTMLSQAVIRFTARRRNLSPYRSPLFLSALQPSPAKCANENCLRTGVQSSSLLTMSAVVAKSLSRLRLETVDSPNSPGIG
jgi:hypothetical protein